MTGTPHEPNHSAPGNHAATPQQRVLNDRYELIRLIGRGGMADVWLARDVLLGRDVAVKILRSDLARDATFQARFRREAKAVAGLNDHGIVAVYDTGDTDVQLPEEGTGLKVPFIVMEYVKGHTLKSRLSAGPLSQRDAVNATLGVLAALSASHDQGIVHRDIKPANVMITDAGTVKVMDFGIARAMADSAATMTQTQAVVGTAQYLSPEQARGESVDARSDLYSTGCLLFELLTGRPPFVGDSPVSVAYQHVGEQPPSASSLNPSVPRELDAVLSMALDKDRDRRFQSARDFATALRTAQRGVMPTLAAAGANPATATTQAIPAAVPMPNEPETETTGSWTGLIPGVAASHQTAAETADADPDQRNKKRKTTIWIICIALVLVLAISGFFLFRWLHNEAERNARIAVPDVAGQTQQQAENALRKADLVPVTKQVIDEEVDRGHVIDTNPGAGLQAKKGSDVTLRVSRGPAEVTVPKNLSGLSQDEAKKRLKSLGFKVSSEVEQVEHDKIAKDLVVDTDPALGETIDNGSEVKLKVSLGQVKIPTDFKGKSQEEVKKSLEDLGLKVSGETKSVSDPSLEQGKVVSTDPEPGSTIKVGGTVTLMVSDGKIPVPDRLTGKLEEEARAALENAGLNIETKAKDSPKPDGTVIEVSPGEGSSVDRGSKVTLTISTGRVSVPDVTGKKQDEATKILENDSHQLKVQVSQSHSDDKQPGTVLSQDPTSGTKLETGSTVTISVADGSSGPDQDDDEDDHHDDD